MIDSPRRATCKPFAVLYHRMQRLMNVWSKHKLGYFLRGIVGRQRAMGERREQMSCTL